MDFWDKYKFALDGTHFNYKNKYNEPISVKDMDNEDVKSFKTVLSKIAKELDMVIEPYYADEYDYWLAGMYIDDEYKIRELMMDEGLLYE